MESRKGQSSEQARNFRAPRSRDAQPSGQQHQTQSKEGQPEASFVGDLVRRLREEKKLTRKQFANQVGYSQSSVRMIESNNSLPSEEKLLRIAEVLETPIEEFRQAYQHPNTIHTTPPEQSKRFLEVQVLCTVQEPL
jgi:DNA-binding XRE family transcriptional regulator